LVAGYREMGMLTRPKLIDPFQIARISSGAESALASSADAGETPARARNPWPRRRERGQDARAALLADILLPKRVG
jgi:hypothetical protein